MSRAPAAAWKLSRPTAERTWAGRLLQTAPPRAQLRPASVRCPPRRTGHLGAPDQIALILEMLNMPDYARGTHRDMSERSERFAAIKRIYEGVLMNLISASILWIVARLA